MAGYILCPFVTGFLPTPAGAIPQVSTTLSIRDHLGTVGARTGFFRNNYKITPGLYAIGKPTQDDQVVVTANYKLTFDLVRQTLSSLNLWLLVVDTRGINVWCAAGKGTFSTEEVVYQVRRSHLSQVVRHRNIILPQLSATGVSAIKLKAACGFRGIFGPIRSIDIPAFLENNMQADERMRSVTFSTRERAVLVPVEVCLIYKPLFFFLLVPTLFSGIGPTVYSITTAISRGSVLLIATLLAILAGAVITPVLLPWIPGRQFWLKGLQTSSFSVLLFYCLYGNSLGIFTYLAIIAWMLAIGSYLGMNFTGSTPYTSLSGVETEMRRGLIVQITLAVIAATLWIIAPFI